MNTGASNVTSRRSLLSYSPRHGPGRARSAAPQSELGSTRDNRSTNTKLLTNFCIPQSPQQFCWTREKPQFCSTEFSPLPAKYQVLVPGSRTPSDAPLDGICDFCLPAYPLPKWSAQGRLRRRANAPLLASEGAHAAHPAAAPRCGAC